MILHSREEVSSLGIYMFWRVELNYNRRTASDDIYGRRDPAYIFSLNSQEALGSKNIPLYLVSDLPADG